MSNFNMQNNQQENNEPAIPVGNFSNSSTQETPSEQIIQEKIINNQINQNFQNNNQQPAQKADYYQNDSSKKVKDFFIGFFGVIIFELIVFFIFHLLEDLIFDNVSTEIILTIINIVQLMTPLIVLITTIIHFFKKGRRFIAVGILSTSILSLLSFGACTIFIFSTFTY
jgi:hypothetical protein